MTNDPHASTMLCLGVEDPCVTARAQVRPLLMAQQYALNRRHDMYLRMCYVVDLEAVRGRGGPERQRRVPPGRRYTRSRLRARATASNRVWAWSLPKMLFRWRLTVPTATINSRAIA